MEEHQQTDIQPKKRKVLRVVLIVLGSFVGLILLLAILVPLLFENQIKKIFISELNKNLATPVVVKTEDIDLQILRHFPEASLAFSHAGIRESFPGSDSNFLEAGEISLLFNIRNILHRNYTINKIIISDGICRLVTDKQGNINYKFWKPGSSGSSEELHISLEAVYLKNMQFAYTDFRNGEDISLLIHNAKMSGDFSSDTYTLSAKGDVLSKNIHISGTDYLRNMETTVNAKLGIDVPQQQYTFQKCSLSIDKNDFDASGSLSFDTNTQCDLTFTGHNTRLEALALLLPARYAGFLRDMKSRGELDFKATLKGPVTATENPALDIAYSVKKANIRNAKFHDALSDVSFEGTYSNGNRHRASSASFSLHNFSGKYGNAPIRLSLLYSDFTDPDIDLTLNGKLPASLLLPFAFGNALDDARGTVALQDIVIKGNVASLGKPSGIASNPPSGTITLDDVSFRRNGEDFHLKEGTAAVNGNSIEIKGLALEAAGSDLLANLTIGNWLQVLFGTPGNRTPAYAMGDITAGTLDLNRLIAAFQNPPSENAGKSGNAEGNWFNFSGNLLVQVNALRYDRLHFSKITAGLKLSPQMITINGFTGNTMDGNFTLDIILRKIPGGNFIFQTEGSISGIDATQLFAQLNNFDQETVTDKNIKGRISSQIATVSVSWDKNLSLIENSIYADADIIVESGELNECKPLESLGNFINVKDLQHITFSTLQNHIGISDRTVHIPAMHIASSALNLDMSGTHTFDNVIDYQFKVSLAEVFVKKFFNPGKYNPDTYEEENGGINMYVAMTGTVDDPLIQYNKKEAKQKLRENGMDQQRFIDIFKKDDDGSGKKSPSKQQADTSEQQLQFIDFDDDDNQQ